MTSVCAEASFCSDLKKAIKQKDNGFEKSRGRAARVLGAGNSRHNGWTTSIILAPFSICNIVRNSDLVCLGQDQVDGYDQIEDVFYATARDIQSCVKGKVGVSRGWQVYPVRSSRVISSRLAQRWVNYNMTDSRGEVLNLILEIKKSASEEHYSLLLRMTNL
jgi:hypothetical protein